MPESVPRMEIRSLLSMVDGVEGVEVRCSALGELEGIDISISGSQSARRVIRDVESALMSGFGLSVDHNKIRVVEGDGMVIEPNGRGNGGNGRGEALRTVPALMSVGAAGRSSGRLGLSRVEIEPDGELYCSVTVELERGGQIYMGHSRDADTRRARMQAIGRATIEAVRAAQETEVAFALEGVEEFQIGGNDAVLVLIRARRGATRQSFQGVAMPDRGPEEAVAKAVLDALNRYSSQTERN